MATNSPPSVDPANRGTLVGLLRHVMTKVLQNTDDMLPAAVISYNRKTNRASLQPSIPYVTTDNQLVQRAVVPSVPVFRFGGGGFAINFPLKPGDNGWIKANDRDISIFKQTGKASPPNTQRKHKFADAMFFPDIIFQVLNISDDDAANLVLSNYAGTSKISIADTYVRFITPGVGIGGIPDANALLDLQSTTQALLLPRMTTAQKLAIPSPKDGMVVYDTTEKGFALYSNGNWS